MTAETLLAGIRDGDYHDGDIRCLPLFRLKNEYFAALRADVMRLCQTERASDVRAPEHITHWARPVGLVVQFSLLNASGRFDDFSVDHDQSCFGKQFHHVEAYPTLAAFVAAFPHTINFRANMMAPGASLSPHEEHAVIRTRAGTVGARARFHLPIVTNPRAEVMLDGSAYHLAVGVIHFVHHGRVHSARNGGDEPRIHLVWDLLLTREAFAFMFGQAAHPEPFVRIAGHEQTLAPLRTERVGACVRLPRVISRDDADQLDWCPVQ